MELCTSQVAKHGLLDLNAYMASQKSKILLFFDNAPVHIVDEATNSRLTYAKVQFFPPNLLTSFLQPLDAGVIRSVKVLSLKHQVLQLLQFIEIGEHAADLPKKLQVIDAMKFMATTSWGTFKTETIQKFFIAC